MGEVKAYPGQTVITTSGNEPDEAIVAKLEKLLQAAKDGQILAFGYCLYNRVDQTQHGWVTGGYGFHLSAAISYFHHAFFAEAEPREID